MIISLTVNDGQDDAPVDEDPDQDGHEVPAEALERSADVLHLKDLSGALKKIHPWNLKQLMQFYVKKITATIFVLFIIFTMLILQIQYATSFR